MCLPKFRFRFRQDFDRNLGLGFGYINLEPKFRFISVSAKFRFRSITSPPSPWKILPSPGKKVCGRPFVAVWIVKYWIWQTNLFNCLLNRQLGRHSPSWVIQLDPSARSLTCTTRCILLSFQSYKKQFCFLTINNLFPIKYRLLFK